MSNTETDYLEKQKRFVDLIQPTVSMRARTELGRLAGVPLTKAPIRNLTDFWLLLGKSSSYYNGWAEGLEARFFAACLACRYGVAAEKHRDRLENKLCRMYWNPNTSDSVKQEITLLLSMKMTEHGQMTRRLSRIIDILGKEEAKTIDLPALIHDLERWNWNKLDGPAAWWARRILAPKKVPQADTENNAAK